MMVASARAVFVRLGEIMKLGHLIEGRVELDSSGCCVIRDPEDNRVFDVQAALKKLLGHSVRFTLISMRDLQELETLFQKSV